MILLLYFSSFRRPDICKRNDPKKNLRSYYGPNTDKDGWIIFFFSYHRFLRFDMTKINNFLSPLFQK